MSRSIRSLFALGFTAAWLGGCAVGEFGSPSASETTPAPVGAPAATATVTQPATQTAAQSQLEPGWRAQQPPPARRAARAPATPPPDPDDDSAAQPMTTTRARELCWMATEDTKNKVKRDMDAKIKFVEKCVDERMKNAAR
jgi:hypothetical protein